MTMKNDLTNYILLGLVCLLGMLSAQAQNLYRPQSFDFLGHDLQYVLSNQYGPFLGRGLGVNAFRSAEQQARKGSTQFIGVPAYSYPIGFGVLQAYGSTNGEAALIYSPTQQDAELNLSLDKDRVDQHLRLYARRYSRPLDRNNDGFQDSPQGQQLAGKYVASMYRGDWSVSGYLHGLQQKQGLGQLGYNGQEDANSDSTYGRYQSVNQWRSLLKVNYRLDSESSFDFSTNLQGHQQSQWFGQREVTGREQRRGMSLSYRHSETRNVDDFFVLITYERIHLDQSLHRWQETQRWDHFKVGSKYSHQLLGRISMIGQAQLDYHTLTGWQVLPSIRLHAQTNDDFRFGFIGGRDYQVVRVLDRLEPFLFANHRYAAVQTGADRMWFAGINVRTPIYYLGNFKQQFKALYQQQYFQQLHLADPTFVDNSLRLVQHIDVPAQHLLQAQLTTHWQRYRASIHYRYRPWQVSYADGREAVLLHSPHSLLAQLSGAGDLNRGRPRHTYQWRTGYLLRSPQTLPSGSESPFLHDLRAHFSVTWQLKPNNYQKYLRTYIGATNLLNQRQDVVYENADEPFSSIFDGTNQWGSPLGAQLYVGLAFDW